MKLNSAGHLCFSPFMPKWERKDQVGCPREIQIQWGIVIFKCLQHNIQSLGLTLCGCVAHDFMASLDQLTIPASEKMDNPVP